jgi:hypothetical protein
MSNTNFPVTWDNLNDVDYWISRIGFIGAPKDKQLKSYYEKGRTAIYMIERLYDTMTKMNLRLPESQKEDIYCILRWMMYEYDSLRQKDNIDINTKRIRRNEYIVKGSLGVKISENIIRIIPKLSVSRQNTMDTLFELFNFSSSIIINEMQRLNDLIKPDELVNDMSILLDMSYSSKGPEALGGSSTKNIMLKMRDIHPSFIGVIDPNCSSNSDVGMSGSIVPTVRLYDKAFFCKEHEPSDNMYNVAKEIYNKSKKDVIDVTPGEETSITVPDKSIMKSAKAFNEWLKEYNETVDLSMMPICIVERDPSLIEDNTEDLLAQTMAAKLTSDSKAKEVQADGASKTTE